MLDQRLGRAEPFPLRQPLVSEFSPRPVPDLTRRGRGTHVDRSLGIPELVLNLEQFGIGQYSDGLPVSRERPRRGDNRIDRCDEQCGG